MSLFAALGSLSLSLCLCGLGGCNSFVVRGFFLGLVLGRVFCLSVLLLLSGIIFVRVGIPAVFNIAVRCSCGFPVILNVTLLSLLLSGSLGFGLGLLAGSLLFGFFQGLFSFLLCSLGSFCEGLLLINLWKVSMY